jgi:hypothetical protein
VVIRRLHLLFEAPGAEPSAHRTVEYLPGHHAGHRGDCGCEPHQLECVAASEWPGLYHGVLEIRLGPLGRNEGQDLGMFRFGSECTKITRAFLLCAYDIE